MYNIILIVPLHFSFAAIGSYWNRVKMKWLCVTRKRSHVQTNQQRICSPQQELPDNPTPSYCFQACLTNQLYKVVIGLLCVQSASNKQQTHFFKKDHLNTCSFPYTMGITATKGVRGFQHSRHALTWLIAGLIFNIPSQTAMPNCTQMPETFVQGQRMSFYKHVCTGLEDYKHTQLFWISHNIQFIKSKWVFSFGSSFRTM